MIEIKRQEIEEIEPIEAFNDFFSSPMMSLLRLPNPRCVKMDDGDGGRPPWWLGTSLGWLSSSFSFSLLSKLGFTRGLNRCRCNIMPLNNKETYSL
jgi:hypothetical protein